MQKTCIMQQNYIISFINMKICFYVFLFVFNITVL